MKILVRTWHKVREEGKEGFQEKNFLKTVELPNDVVSRINQWAKEQQINLLIRKYNSPQDINLIDSQKQEFAVSQNHLYKELQREGFRSDEQLLAIGFLFTSHRDNPELIDLEVATKFLCELEQERQPA